MSPDPLLTEDILEHMETADEVAEEQKKYGNPKDAVGRAKPPTHGIPPVAVLECGRVMADGEAKYGPFNWRVTRDLKASTYYDAMQRHLLAWWDGESKAADSQRSHIAHIMANCAILLDCLDLGILDDDRPPVGGAGRLINGGD
jgi:hypothetical protein